MTTQSNDKNDPAAHHQKGVKHTGNDGHKAKKDTQHTTSNNEKEIEQLKQELSILQTQLQAMTETAKRAMADLQNFRRRSDDEKKQFIEYANAHIMLELIDINENFNRALKSIPEEFETNEWIKGILNIQKQLLALFEKYGLKEIPTIEHKLDPSRHEALMQGPGEKDIVIEELEKGYLLGNRVLKPAKVKVGNGEK